MTTKTLATLQLIWYSVTMSLAGTCDDLTYSTAQNQVNIEHAFVTRRVKRAHAFCCVTLHLNFAL